jgi:Protein of unknown function (DUF2975)
VTQKSVPPLNSRLCRRLAVLTGWSGAGILIINAILWLVPDLRPFIAREMADLQCEPITLTPMVPWMGLACSTLYLAVLVRGLMVARSVFRRLADGLVFEAQTGVLLRRFGVTLVVYAALTPFVGTLMTWLVTMHNASGQKILRFGISEYEIVLAIVGTLVLTTGSVMAEAARLAEDNRQII